MKQAVCHFLLLILSALILTVSPMPLLAQQSDQKASANERINFSGKLRMLSQQVAAAACNLGADIDQEKSRQVLTLASAEFVEILEGLESGNSDLNIKGAETDKSVLAALQVVNEQWVSFAGAADRLVNERGSSADKDLINNQNLALLDSAQALVKSVLESYSNRSAADDDFGKVIDVAGRQRMLTQKMSKEACQIWSGLDSDEKVKSLQSTMEQFENSLIGLREGSEELIEPPNQRIEQGLALIWEKWIAIKPVLQKALARQTIDPDARKQLFRELNQTLREMNLVVGFYTVAQKEKGNVEDNGASERVNFSGKLRMLSQRVAAAACNYKAGVETDRSRQKLIEAQAEFYKILQALEFGDGDLRINGLEKRRKTLQALANVHGEWEPVNAAIAGILNSENVDENLAVIYDLNMSLLSEAKLLVSEISGEYSDPSVMTQSAAMLVDISGRQRMFTQKLSKESCFIWSGQSDRTQDLAESMKLFEASLLALRDGLEFAGIRAAPTEEIMYALEDIWQKWETLKPTLETAASGEMVDTALRGNLSQELDTIMSEMNTVVVMYTIHGKTGL